jgi:hypothetical protein
LITQARSHAPDTVAQWLYAAVQGAAALSANAEAATDIAARLLALTIHAATAQGPEAANLVSATRQALIDANDPDLPSSFDPLYASVTLLRNLYAKTASHALAARYVIATFSALPKLDRHTVVQAVLA